MEEAKEGDRDREREREREIGWPEKDVRKTNFSAKLNFMFGKSLNFTIIHHEPRQRSSGG